MTGHVDRVDVPISEIDEVLSGHNGRHQCGGFLHDPEIPLWDAQRAQPGPVTGACLPRKVALIAHDLQDQIYQLKMACETLSDERSQAWDRAMEAARSRCCARSKFDQTDYSNLFEEED